MPLIVNKRIQKITEKNLVATVNCTETLIRGHHTVFIKQPNSSSWFFCNDAAVFRSSVKKINNTS